VANSKSIVSTASFYYLAANIAASLQRLAISAPENPGVNVANLFAISSFGFFGSTFRGSK
jgi:hypothetical protein